MLSFSLAIIARRVSFTGGYLLFFTTVFIYFHLEPFSRYTLASSINLEKKNRELKYAVKTGFLALPRDFTISFF